MDIENIQVNGRELTVHFEMGKLISVACRNGCGGRAESFEVEIKEVVEDGVVLDEAPRGTKKALREEVEKISVCTMCATELF